jgi:hypothetical protein
MPAVINRGMHATLSIVSRAKNKLVHLTSSDPAVIGLPDSAGAPADLDLTALAEGTTTITATNADGVKATMSVIVGAPGESRWLSDFQLTVEGAALFYGAPRKFTARVDGRALVDNAFPTGNVTFREGEQVHAVVPLDAKGVAQANINWLLPGTHTITATYSGDAHFSTATVTAPPLSIHTPLPPAFAGLTRAVSATEDEVMIVIVVPAGSPGGTIALNDLAKNRLVENVPVVAGRAVARIPRQQAVTVFYSGDGLFPPAIVNVNLVPWHPHAAAH